MLILGSRLLNSPIMSLQTGAKLAQASKPLIDPATFRITAYEVDGPLLTQRPSFISTQDIREYGRLGMIIDSSDELLALDDVIKIKQIYELRFSLIGIRVIDENKRKLGKVEDYTLDTDNFVIQQITVRRGFFQGITDTGFLVNRSQIIEVSDDYIVVKSPSVKSSEPVMQAIRSDFVNPFRSQKPQQVKSETQQ